MTTVNLYYRDLFSFLLFFYPLFVLVFVSSCQIVLYAVFISTYYWKQVCCRLYICIKYYSYILLLYIYLLLLYYYHYLLSLFFSSFFLLPPLLSPPTSFSCVTFVGGRLLYPWKQKKNKTKLRMDEEKSWLYYSNRDQRERNLML